MCQVQFVTLYSTEKYFVLVLKRKTLISKDSTTCSSKCVFYEEKRSSTPAFKGWNHWCNSEGASRNCFEWIWHQNSSPLFSLPAFGTLDLLNSSAQLWELPCPGKGAVAGCPGAAGVASRRLCAGGAPGLSYQELKDLKKTSVLHIDVRERWEVDRFGKIPASINIPLGELVEALQMDPMEFKEQYNQKMPSKSDPVVFSCLAGTRSKQALSFAMSLGFSRSGKLFHWSGCYYLLDICPPALCHLEELQNTLHGSRQYWSTRSINLAH
ncbi:thiosulfate sulfurtransferase/rhodanese-like domain-containing protein 3 isoform X2 [Aquila chrysaetos chrysaetos]|uniref:thiosulfate sulfurtransferase/rhodanese-like domain-containing protein 3 isoform X2 n=1 Tax=Aquila chrysaetos chrysaetos TaxID=223781 RepID=UPI00117657E4|nr:thiosulfate sulfurtransferase/rhodanese-like domain-containing protein 3 isoform X2 [Aquila chrysaetos chrysaetos]